MKKPAGMPSFTPAGHLLFFIPRASSRVGILPAARKRSARKDGCFSCLCTIHPLQNSIVGRSTYDAMRWATSSWGNDNRQWTPHTRLLLPTRPAHPACQVWQVRLRHTKRVPPSAPAPHIGSSNFPTRYYNMSLCFPPNSKKDTIHDHAGKNPPVPRRREFL